MNKRRGILGVAALMADMVEYGSWGYTIEA